MPTKVPNGKMTVSSSCAPEFRIQIVQGRKREKVSAFSKDNGNCVKSRDIWTRLLSVSIQASVTMSEVPFRLQETWFLSQLCHRPAGSTGIEKRKGTHSVLVARSCTTLCDPHGQPARILCPWNFPGKNTGVGCHFLLQGIFLTQGWSLVLLHCRQILYHLSHQGYVNL